MRTPFPLRFGSRVISTKRIQLPIGPDDMCAAAVDAVFVPGRRVHERLDEKAKGVRLVHLEFLEQRAQRLVLATAFHQVFKPVAHLVAEETLHLSEVDELADRTRAAVQFQQIANRRAVRIATRQRCEILEAQPPATLRDGSEDDVGGVEGS